MQNPELKLNIDPVYASLKKVGVFFAGTKEEKEMAAQACEDGILQPAAGLMKEQGMKDILAGVYVRAVLESKYELPWCLHPFIAERRQKKPAMFGDGKAFKDKNLIPLKELKERAKTSPFAQLVMEQLIPNGDLKAGAKGVYEKGLALGLEIPRGASEAEMLLMIEELLRDL